MRRSQTLAVNFLLAATGTPAPVVTGRALGLGCDGGDGNDGRDPGPRSGPARADGVGDSTITFKFERAFSEPPYDLWISVHGGVVPEEVDEMGVEVRRAELAVLYPDPVSGLINDLMTTFRSRHQPIDRRPSRATFTG